MSSFYDWKNKYYRKTFCSYLNQLTVSSSSDKESKGVGYESLEQIFFIFSFAQLVHNGAKNEAGASEAVSAAAKVAFLDKSPRDLNGVDNVSHISKRERKSCVLFPTLYPVFHSCCLIECDFIWEGFCIAVAYFQSITRHTGDAPGCSSNQKYYNLKKKKKNK